MLLWKWLLSLRGSLTLILSLRASCQTCVAIYNLELLVIFNFCHCEAFCKKAVAIYNVANRKSNNGIFEVKGEIVDYGLPRVINNAHNDEVVKLQVCGIMDCFGLCPRNDEVENRKCARLWIATRFSTARNDAVVLAMTIQYLRD